MLQLTTFLLLSGATPAPQPAPLLQDETAPAEAAAKMELPNAADSDDPALAKMAEFIKSLKIDKSQPRWKTQLAKPPKLEFTEGVDYFWNMETNKGVMSFKLFPDVAPMHASSTIFLSRNGFYDNLTFHRVIPRFMAQGGCPQGSGTGNPGYKYGGEFSKDVRHDRPGLLSMANAGPETDGSQFFITFVPTPHLDDKHTIFGAITKGQEVLRTLEAAGSGRGQTTEPLVIKKTSISLGRAKSAGHKKMDEMKKDEMKKMEDKK